MNLKGIARNLVYTVSTAEVLFQPVLPEDRRERKDPRRKGGRGCSGGVMTMSRNGVGPAESGLNDRPGLPLKMIPQD